VNRPRALQRVGHPWGHGSFGRVYRGLVRSAQHPGARPSCPAREDDARSSASRDVNAEGDDARTGTSFFKRPRHYEKVAANAPTLSRPNWLLCRRMLPILVLMEADGERRRRNLEDLGLRQMLRRADSTGLGPDQRPMYASQAGCAVVRPDLRRHVLPGDEEVCCTGHLAARNCMVNGRLPCVKIGVARARRLCQSAGWRRSPYATVCSPRPRDVWSYGVVLWEIATLAHQPFNSRSNEEVVNMVKSGKTLQPPEDCPAFLSELMAHCWAQKPRSRASFRDILIMLDEMPELIDAFRRQSWFHNGSLSSQGDSAVSNGNGKRLSQQAQQEQQQPPEHQDGPLKPPEEIPMLGQQSVPNPYVPLRA
uniref:Protein kinase domain-containing protein n=1 Tax=Macrostomum lignano TaxID=282301 RepID=A0A1I8FJ32_9PLAT